MSVSILFDVSTCRRKATLVQILRNLGGSPGLVVMGGDLCSKGHGFKSWRRILDAHNIFIFVVRLLMVV